MTFMTRCRIAMAILFSISALNYSVYGQTVISDAKEASCYNCTPQALKPADRPDDSGIAFTAPDEIAGGYELTVKRDRTSKHFQMPDGNVKSVLSSGGSLHYLKNGKWEDINNTIIPIKSPLSNYAFQNEANAFTVMYPGSSAQGILFNTSLGSVKTWQAPSVSWQDAQGNILGTLNPTTTVGNAGNTNLVYPGVYQGIDARFTQHSDAVELDYVINNRQFLNQLPASAAFLIFSETVELPVGWRVEAVEGREAAMGHSAINIIDATGTTVLNYQIPYFYDNAGISTATNSIYGGYKYELNGQKLTIHTLVPVNWLMALEREFPITIDPTVNVSPNNTANWTGRVYSDGYKQDDLIRFGRFTDGYNVRGWARFNTTTIPDANVVSDITVNFNISAGSAQYSPGNGYSLAFSQLLNNPVTRAGSSLYFDISVAGYTPIMTAAINSLGFKSHSITSTQAFTDMQNGLAANWFALGFMPIGSFTTGHYLDASGRSNVNRPYLTVTHAPAATCAPGTATAASLNLFEPAATADLTLTGYTATTIQWQSSPNGSTGWATVSGGTGGATANYTSGTLTQGTYYYRAEVTDGGSCTDYSNVVTITVYPQPFFTDDFSSSTGWTTQTAQYYLDPNYETRWLITNCATYNIDGTASLQIVAVDGYGPTTYCGSYWEDFTVSGINARKQIASAAGYSDMTLFFDWKCMAERDAFGFWDYGEVGYSLDGTNFTWMNSAVAGASGHGYNNQGQYVSANTNQFAIVPLPSALNNQPFYLAFRWFNDDNSSNYPSFVVDNIRIAGTSVPLVCAPVSNLAAAIGSPANGTDHHIDVTWDALLGATGYDIEYSNTGAAPWTSLGSVTTNSYDHNTGDNPNVPYYYRVRGKDASTTCAFATMATPRYTAADQAVNPTVSNIGTNSVDVTLVAETPVANPAITTYSLYEVNTGQYVQANGTLGATEVFQTKAAWGTKTVTGLNANSNYCFVPTAKNNDGHEVDGFVPVSTLWDASGVEDFTSYTSTDYCGLSITQLPWMFCTLSAPNGVWTHSNTAGCSSSSALQYTAASASNGSGSLMRSARFSAVGQNTVTVSFDMTNSYNASYTQDQITVSISDWSYSGGFYNYNTATASQVVNFDHARNCERVDLTFDISALTYKSNLVIAMWTKAQTGSAAHSFNVVLDNMSVNYIGVQACATTQQISAPDLVVQSVTPSATTVCGSGTVSYDVVVRNAGTQPITSGTSFSVEAFTGGLVCGGAAAATQNFSGGLAVNATTTLTFNLNISGSGNVSFNVDAGGAITEQDESNNCTGNSAVTIASGLGGTYTIGGTSPDYATFTAAVSALNTNGVCGPVVFNVRTGNYNENITINTISGASSVNTVTFQAESGNAADVVLYSTANNYIVNLTGATYVTFNELTISYTGTSGYGSFRLQSKADNNTVKNCVLSSSSSNTGTAHSLVYVSQSSTSNKIDYLTLENNTLNGGYYGINFTSASGATGLELKIIGNTFNNQLYRAIYISYNDYTVIDGNTINKSAGLTTYVGMYLNQVNEGASIQRNTMVIAEGTIAIDFNGCVGTSANPTLVANNMVRISSSNGTGLKAFNFSTNSTYANFYYNTISYHQANNYSGTACLYITGTITDASINIVNNIFTNTSGLSNQVGVYLASSNNTADINNWSNNNYYFTGSSHAGYVNSSNRTTVANMQSATSKDAGSISVNPVFTSATDLHVTATGLNVGTYISTVLNDVDGQTRSTTAPFIGADEAIVCTVGEWTAGGGTNQWFNPANWSCNTVPTISIDAVIPTGVSVYPADYGGNTTVPVKSLTIETGASVTMAAGANFTIAGDLTVDAGGSVSEVSIAGAGPNITLTGDFTITGTFTNNFGKVTLNGSSAQTITGNITLNNLELNNTAGATISGSLGVKGVLGLRNGVLNTNNSLTILSDATKTGMIDDFSGASNSSLSGNVTVQRYVANSANYFFYTGSPVGGANMADWGADFAITTYNGAGDGSQVVPTATCDPTQLQTGSPYGTLFDYRENQVQTCNLQGWHVRTGGNINEGQGYIGRIANGTVVDLTGPANSGSRSTPNLTRSAGNGTIHQGFNLISNPYPSPLDWLVVYAGNSAKVTGTAYLYQTTGPLAGTYQSVNSISGGSTLIGSSQAMFVEAVSNNVTVNFNNNMRSLGDNAVLRQSPGYDSKLTINLSGNGYNDVAMIAFGDNFTDTFDQAFDARKLNSSVGQPTMFTIENGERRSIHALPVNTTARVIPLNLLPGANGSFTMSFEDITTFAPTALIYLEDLKTGTIQNLRVNDTYTFTSNVADNEARFLLHFLPKATSEVVQIDCQGQPGSISIDLGVFNVNNTTVQWDSYILTNSTGATVMRGGQVSGVLDFLLLPAETYTLELNISGYVVTETFTINTSPQVVASFLPSASDVVVGEPIFFSNGSTTGNYLWDFADGNTSTDVEPLHTYTQPGSYTVTLTVDNGICTHTLDGTITVNDISIGVDAVKGEAISISGFANEIRVSFSNFADELVQVEVYDILGNRILLEDGIQTGVPVHYFHVNDVSTGYYVVRVFNTNRNYTEKVFLGSDK